MQLADGRVLLAFRFQNLRKVIVNARVRGIQLHRRLKMLSCLFVRLFLIAQNTEMKMRRRKVGLQPQSLGKLCSGFSSVRLLHQRGPEIVVQLRPLRLQFDRSPQFAGRAIEVSGEIEHSPQGVMRLRIARGQSRGFLRFAQRGG